MKAFLSYQFNDNITGVANLLTSQGVDVFDSMTDIEYGKSFQKAIKDAISACDFVVIFYTSSNPNIAFEAGIAFSINKPIFAIVSETRNHPDFLFDSTYVRALPNELDKIEFNLKIFLNKIKPSKKTFSIKSNKYYGGGFPNFYNEIFRNYNQLNKNSETSYELFFKDIFEKYNLNVVQNKLDNKTNFYTDFCIWSDQLSNVLGNPILVEIKKEINFNSINKLQKTIEKLIENNAAESCLIFYDDLIGLSKKELPNTSKYLFIQISDFIEKLADKDFNDSIRIIRNEIVHNQF